MKRLTDEQEDYIYGLAWDLIELKTSIFIDDRSFTPKKINEIVCNTIGL